ncbi:MAG: CSLREA domain-containing protein, partial [Pseudomonadota bacterium]
MARAGPLLVGALIFVFVGIASGQTVLNISVDSLDDDEPTAGCTLREAITMANNGMSESVGCVAIAAGSGEPRSFRIELPAFTYTLVGDGGENDNLSGDLDVLGNLNIAGAGQNLTIIRGPSDDAVFHVIAASARLRLEDLAVEGGG